jgi:hypothetical protein
MSKPSSGTKRVLKAVAVFFGLVLVGLAAWTGVERKLTDRAFNRYLEDRKPYTARVLEQVGVVPDELSESSGLAVSRTQPGVLWSHNDSGDGPNLYAIDLSGRLLAVIPVAGAAAEDWEDMSSGPCPADMATQLTGTAQSCLYLADIGDNNRRREELTVYVLVEPKLPSTGAKAPTVTARSFRYRYPDGPDDAEAFAVAPEGDVTIVSKGRSGSIDFFGIPAASVSRALGSGELLTAERGGNSGITPNAEISRLVTSAAVSRDGTTLAVRTYNEVFFYGAVEEQGGTHWRDLKRPCFLGDAEPQGEAIDYLGGETLLLTSERARGRPGSIHRLQC